MTPSWPVSPHGDAVLTVRVVGVDLSMRSTGIARVTINGTDRPATATTTVGRPGEAHATLIQRWHRLDATRDSILDEIAASLGGGDGAGIGPGPFPHLVVMEGPAPRQAANAYGDDMTGLRWLILDRILAENIPVTVVAPTTLKAYATGNGHATKLEVTDAIRRHYGDTFTIPTGRGASDIADAITLTAMGCRALGQPIDSLPQQHVRAMRTPKWPTRKDHTS